MKNDPAEVRYPGVQAKVQEYLRQRGDGHVTTADVTANVNATRTTLSSVMAVLARTSDTGLTHVSAGLYRFTRALDKEYVAQKKRDGIDVPQPGASVEDPALKITHPPRPTPADVPQRRTYPGEPVAVVSAREIHHSMETSPSGPGLGVTRDGTPRKRKRMQRDIGVRALRFLQAPENKGDIFSISEVAEAIGALHSSVSTVLRLQAESADFPVKRIMPGTLYTVPLSAAEEEKEWERATLSASPELQGSRDRAANAHAEGRTTSLDEELQAAPVAKPEAPEPEPAPAPAPIPAPADDNMVLLEKLAELEPGTWIATDADRRVYRLTELG